MSTAPRPPLLRRASPRTRAVLVWSGAGLFPLAVFAMVLVGPRDPGIPLPGSAYLRPVLVMALPAGWSRGHSTRASASRCGGWAGSVRCPPTSSCRRSASCRRRSPT